MSVQPVHDVGLVVIGRNEGERLKRCLRSISSDMSKVAYVDSGSSDGSSEWALAAGVEVVELDLALPFTAARARNAGLERLMVLHPGLRLVQFVDGDCELSPRWLATAAAFLADHDDIAVVAGRLRERHPEDSVYNLLCDIEWNTPVGEARACGGVAMMRTDALLEVNSFNSSLIAGEEPELCVRLRAAGWRIWRLPDEMAWHDAAMTHFRQWWRRMRRSGHAFAQGRALHGSLPERHYVVETRRAVGWGILLPLVCLAGALANPAVAWLLLAYPLQMLRLGLIRSVRREQVPWTQAFFLVIGRLPEGLGVASYWWSRWRNLTPRLIEYK